MYLHESGQLIPYPMSKRFVDFVVAPEYPSLSSSNWVVVACQDGDKLHAFFVSEHDKAWKASQPELYRPANSTEETDETDTSLAVPFLG